MLDLSDPAEGQSCSLWSRQQAASSRAAGPAQRAARYSWKAVPTMHRLIRADDLLSPIPTACETYWRSGA